MALQRTVPLHTVIATKPGILNGVYKRHPGNERRQDFVIIENVISFMKLRKGYYTIRAEVRINS